MMINPLFAPFSIYALLNCSSPPFLLTRRALNYFPRLLVRFSDALKKSLDTEEKEHGFGKNAKDQSRMMYWTVIIEAILLIWHQSRGFRLFYNIFQFVLIIVSNNS